MNNVVYYWTSFFAATFYETNYLKSVDLEVTTKKTILDKPKYQQDAKTAQTLLNDPAILATIGKPFTINGNEQRNEEFKARGFKVLGGAVLGGSDEPFASALEHPRLSRWLIKPCGGRMDEINKDAPLEMSPLPNAHGEMNQISTYESMLRVPMRKHLKEVAKKSGVMNKQEGFSFLMPKEKYLPIPSAAPTGTFGSRFCIMSEKLDILSQEETEAYIRNLTPQQQRVLAQDMTKVVKAGYSDAHFGNIRFIRNTKKWTIIDTEPMGAMVAKQDIRTNSSDSIEKCARVGMAKLSLASSTVNLGDFASEVDKEYKKLLSPKYSYLKIALAFTLIYPLVVMIQSIWKTVQLHIVATEFQSKTQELQSKVQAKMMSNPQNISKLISSPDDLKDSQKMQALGTKIIQMTQDMIMSDPVMRALSQEVMILQKKMFEITNGALGKIVPINNPFPNMIF